MPPKKNITYIISNINKALAFEWIAASLNKDKFNLDFILLNPGDSELESYLKKNSIPVKRIKYNGKKDIPKAILSVYKLLRKNKTDIVHTHLFDANIVGLSAAKLAGISKRIHTRHHSDYHHKFHPKAIKYDKWVNKLSTDIIAISQVVKNILIKENVNENKIHIIHHGFMLDEFIHPNETEVKKLKEKYNTNGQHPVVGVISRYIEWKGIQYIIPAFKQLLKEYPDALLILANAGGNYKPEIEKLLQGIPKKNYQEIPFESDIFSLYQVFDIFVHVPFDAESEAFGQTYVESLAAGIPSVFTLSGIAHEFIVDKQNAIVVPYKDSDAIHLAILEILNHKIDTAGMIAAGKNNVSESFTLDKMILSLEKLYVKVRKN